jgi:hypothetical protein
VSFPFLRAYYITDSASCQGFFKISFEEIFRLPDRPYLGLSVGALSPSDNGIIA